MNTGAKDYLLYELPIQQDATVVRRLTPYDFDAFFSYRSDPELARYQGWEPMSCANARTYLDKASATRCFVDKNWIQLGIADSESDALLGDLGICLEVRQARAEIGFTLSQQAQGRGHARRAVKITCEFVLSHTEAQTVKAITDTRNTASIRLLKASGFNKVDEVYAVFKGEHCREAIYLLEKRAS